MKCRLLESDGLEYLWETWSHDYKSIPQKYPEASLAKLKEEGVLGDALNYYRSILFDLPLALESTVLHAPILGVYGEEDGCVMAKVFEYCMGERPELYPEGIELKPIAKAGHWAHPESVAEVNSLIVNHINKHN